MFGESVMVGSALLAIDEKGRFNLPRKITKVEPLDEIAIVNGLNFLKLYNLKILKSKLEEQIAKDYFFDESKMEKYYLDILGTAVADNQRRIVIPKTLFQTFSFEKEIVLCGFGNHCRLYTSVDEYKKSIR